MHGSTKGTCGTTSLLIYQRPTLLLPADPYGEPELQLPPERIQVRVINGQVIHEPVGKEGE